MCQKAVVQSIYTIELTQFVEHGDFIYLGYCSTYINALIISSFKNLVFIGETHIMYTLNINVRIRTVQTPGSTMFIP
jgi:hypothetical protein